MTTATLPAPTYCNVGREFRNRHPMEDLLELCPQAQTIIDVGAGAGFFAGECKRTWQQCRIYSFEPVSKLHRQIPIDASRTAIRCALSDVNGFADINLTAGEKSNSLLGFLPDGPLESHCRVIGQENVLLRRLDDVIDEHSIQNVSILKMDVQGHELAVLRGCPTLLASKPIIYTEVAFQQQYADHPLVDDVDAFLSRHGYERLYLYASAMPHIWGDAIYVPRGMSTELKLNIGAGSTVIPGYTAIDRKLGSEAYPLPYADNSVSDIRCSHMLEHLSFREVPKALEEWRRVLKPGGRLRVAVPDVKKIAAKIDADQSWAYELMGGQTDGDDFHKSAYDEARLAGYLHQAGLVGIQHWESPNTDTAAHPVSLNLEAFKPEPEAPENLLIKVKGVMSVPRIGWNDAGVAIDSTLRPFGIHCERFNGVFWGQCMQRAFEAAVAEGVDWILALDYDSMPVPEHLDHMMHVFGTHPEIDALAPLQMRRGQDYPLMTQGGKTEIEITGEPIKVHTAHFGMTLLRVEALKALPKPWFMSKPDANGEWGDDRQDDDIWFWHQWRLAGKTVYVDPEARIGHLELMVSEFDDDMQPKHIPIGDWWAKHRKKS